ncbi:MAG TPA: phospholipase D family protein [Casimicrobiaceae bacterium]|jgi:putative cardiolipin synthase|nr:phospholipase D family protein [Casimicrobiaceae bacterium]
MTRTLSIVVVAFVILISGCASLPALEGRTTTTAFVDTSETRLGHALAADVAANPGKTGIYPLSDPRDAFAARLLLADAAEKSLDAQYFIWHGDEGGYLLFEGLWRAAERGVRVRLLLDDFYTAGLDPMIAALDAHPNVEVRLYNPLAQRAARTLNLLTDFTRVNRRMHNKSFTVDNQVSIVGGRNIGNEYFGAGSGVAFADLDVIAVGAAVSDVSKQFDVYWNSPSAYPAAKLVRVAPAEGVTKVEAMFATTRADPDSVAYLQAAGASPIVRNLLDHKLNLEWLRARLVYDDPAKTLDTNAGTDVLLFPELVRAVGPAEKSFDLVTPYFVPGEEGTAALAALASRGVKVRIATNSLASNDVKAVHAGYAKRRKDLLRAGVVLYELKPTAAQESHELDVPWFGSGSSSALHAKTFAVDRSRGFVGSFNFTPRSELLNTEMGLVIESTTLAERLAQTFDTTIPLVAYEVRLAPDDQTLYWIERTATGEVRYDTEPGTSWFLRRGVDILRVLPIDSLL